MATYRCYRAGDTGYAASVEHQEAGTGAIALVRHLIAKRPRHATAPRSQQL
jgi:hypothetical protein